jgi:hypothetical protein
MQLHADGQTAISFVLYLSDGGASTLFPLANDLANIPKKGSALTWLNVNDGGNLNPKAFHAVQAQPASAGERNIMLLQIDLDPSKVF